MSRTDDKYLKQLQKRYRKASKKERTAILDEFVKTTGYHRKHATAVLNGRRERVEGQIRRPRAKVYGADVACELVQLADLFDNICSKRLRAALDAELPRLYQAGNDPQTPYARTLASDLVSEEDKAQVRQVYSHLDLLALRQRINELQDQLLATVSQ